MKFLLACDVLAIKSFPVIKLNLLSSCCKCSSLIINKSSLIPVTKTEPRAVGTSTYKKTQKKRICVKTMALKKLGRKMSGPQGTCQLLSVLLINSKIRVHVHNPLSKAIF